MTWAWMETSRAETGSSADDQFGVQGQGPGDADSLASGRPLNSWG